jgi:fructose-1-phosphate kinase PfkB-like protein
LQAAKEMHANGVEYAMISLGADGAVLACEEGAWSAESPKVEVLSTIGSGDSLLGGFLAALERGESAVESFRQGIAAGAATAMSNGAEIGSAIDIDRLKPLVRIQPE